MGYGIALAADGAADLRALEPWLQEEVIDELEILAANPTILSGHRNKVLYAFSRVLGQQRHHVSLTLLVNEKTHMITLLGIAWQVIAPPAGE